MTYLVQLDDNLTNDIFRHVEQRDLRSLALSCKALKRRAEPLLYETIDWTWQAARDEKRNPQTQLLLRSVVQNSRLGSHVKHVSFQAVGYRVSRDESKPTSTPKLKPKELARAIEAIATAGLQNPHQWQAALADGNLDATVALFLAQLCNLLSLSIGPDLLKNNQFLGMLFEPKPVGGIVSKFKRLKDVYLGAQIDDHDFNHYEIPLVPGQFLPFFYLPALRSAEMFLPDAEGRDYRARARSEGSSIVWPLNPPRAAALTSLKLRRARATPAMLESLLIATPKLEKLEYDWWCEWPQNLHGDDLMRALWHVRKTLVMLKVVFTPFDKEPIILQERGEEWLSEPLGSLRGFLKLRYLEISLVVLLGYYDTTAARLSDVLPPNLLAVCFRDDLWGFSYWPWEEEQSLLKFEEFLQDGWRNSTPKLQRLNLRIDTCDSDWGPAGRKTLIKACKKQGLKCGIIKTESND
ncbi:MAG: hypothetical protein M1820_007662 [Bogoriella megaspora]|nr:MAG: hypothetical protein M1820_007662 [Bogoriella megaspora]